MIMNVLDRYIGRTILVTIFSTLFMLVGLSAIIKFVEQFRSIGRGTYDITQAILYTVLTMPKDIETFYPLAALLGALIGLGMLAASSELVVMQSSGFSRFKIGLSVLKTAIPMILIIMVIGEWGIPQTEQYARNMRTQAISGGSLISVQNGVWAKDGNEFIYIKRIADTSTLRGITIYKFNDNQKLQSISQANLAQFKDNHWVFNQLHTNTVTSNQVKTSNHLNTIWQTTLTPDKLGIVSLRPSSLSITGLYDYVQFLKQTGQDASRFELTFWHKLFQPISITVMMLLALSFIFGPLRSVTTGARVLTGIVFGFMFYVIDQIFGPLTIVYNVSPIVGALMPSLLFLALTWWLLTRKRS